MYILTHTGVHVHVEHPDSAKIIVVSRTIQEVLIQVDDIGTVHTIAIFASFSTAVKAADLLRCQLTTRKYVFDDMMTCVLNALPFRDLVADIVDTSTV